MTGGRVLAAAAALTLATAATPALSVGLSLNYVTLPSHVTLEACLNLAENQFANLGLSVLERTSSAAWAEPIGGADELYSVYCIIDRSITVVVGAGDDLDQVDSQLGVLVQNLDYAFNGK